jgi:Prolipoprotein diacylglyceryl transferase
VAYWGVPAGLIGARTYFDITTPFDIVPKPCFAGLLGDVCPPGHQWWGPLAIWNGGQGVWGGIVAGALVGAWRVRRAGGNVGVFMDAVAPALLVAQAIVRIGNYFDQQLFGKPSTLPWAVQVSRAARLHGHRAAPLGHLGAGQLPQPRGHPAPRRHRRHRLRERLARAGPVLAPPPPLHPAHAHRIQALPQVPRPGHDPLVLPAGPRPATGAARRIRMIGDHPDRNRAVSLTLGVEDPQALHAEQHRCRILGHSAGSLLIMRPSENHDLRAAGVLITASRQHQSPAPPPAAARAASSHTQLPDCDTITANFEDPKNGDRSAQLVNGFVNGTVGDRPELRRRTAAERLVAALQGEVSTESGERPARHRRPSSGS